MKEFLSKHKKLFIYFPLGLYWLILVIATSMPTENFQVFETVSDKLKHFGAYLGLAFLLSFTLMFQEKNKKLARHYLIFSFLFTVIYGLLDEIHQAFIPGRFYELLDWAADAGGALVGCLLFGLFAKYFLRNNSDHKSELNE